MEHRRGASRLNALFAIALLPLANVAFAQTAILGSTTAGAAYVFPNVTFTGACPALTTTVPVTGITGQPHGVGYYGSDFALISDFGASRVFNVQISTHTVLNTIPTGAAGYNGQSSIAVAPNLQYALMAAGSSLTVMQAPFSAPTFTNLTLPGGVSSFQTQAIVFDATSRAYIAHSAGISVLDPPYTSIAFTMAGSGLQGLAITPDANVLLATTLGTSVLIYTGPFSAGTTSVTLPVTGASQLDGIVSTPNGARVLVVDAGGGDRIFSIAAPYNATSVIDTIPIPSGTGSLEDISVSADGNFALATGNNGGSAPLIRGPFTAAGATACAVPITGGRGAGAVRFLPTTLQPPIGPPPATLPVPTLSQWALMALGVLLSFAAFRTLRRRYH
jgi:hypothetical protein